MFENLIIFDTTIGSMNVGDEIIAEAAYSYLDPLAKRMNLRKYSSRIPSFNFFTMKKDSRYLTVKNSKMKIILGTNLLKSCMLHRINQLNINLFNMKPYKNLVLFGVGSEVGRVYLDKYTRYVYTKTFSHSFIHSVRDERTKTIMTDLGLKSINTGCPTIWNLTKEKCEKIPKDKSKRVVFTLHFGKKDKQRDLFLIDVLRNNYSKLIFFPQSIEDINYLQELTNIEDIRIIPSSFSAYKELLSEGELDYVGVRLHGGIYALSNNTRSIIISIDERMRQIDRLNNLNCLDVENLENLESIINQRISFNVRNDYTVINEWLGQFQVQLSDNKEYCINTKNDE